jgi:hypothetical protein
VHQATYIYKVNQAYDMYKMVEARESREESRGVKRAIRTTKVQGITSRESRLLRDGEYVGVIALMVRYTKEIQNQETITAKRTSKQSSSGKNN